MSEEITTPKPPVPHEYLRYLAALYRLGMHDTMRMMKDGENVYAIAERPYSLKFY